MNRDALPSVPLSPLAFARAYQRYRADAARTPLPDSRLLLAARFWADHPGALEGDGFETYRREDLPPLLAIAPDTSFDDLWPDETEAIARFIESAARLGPDTAPGGPEPARRIWETAARSWFYLGEAEHAIEALARIDLAAAWADKSVGPTDTLGEPEMGAPDTLVRLPYPHSFQQVKSVLSEIDSLDAAEIPEILADLFASDAPDTARWLNDFATAWLAKKEDSHADRANCVLVEYDTNGRAVRGRLRTLEGKIEPLDAAADADEVIFHHQVRSPDDPFVGTVYAALAVLRRLTNPKRKTTQSIERHSESASADEESAVNHPPTTPECHSEERSDEESAVSPSPSEKQILRHSVPQDDSRAPRPKRHNPPRFRARFSFAGNSGETYSGDSIGLATFAVAYGVLLGRGILRGFFLRLAGLR